jgi:hypothetical protein
MMLPILTIVVRVCAVAVLALQGLSAGDWSRADAATTRLPPSEYQTLAAPLRGELQRRGCTIPQVYTGGPAHNVVRGSFRTAGHVDTAVLCSRQRASSILVFWGSDPKDVSDLAARSDAKFLQVIAPGHIGFSRLIRAASPAFIREHEARARGGFSPATHDGIEDVFVEKASIVWYWWEGRWLQLTGAD